MIRLVGIELYKLLRQRRTYLALFALLVIECFVLAVAYYQGKGILDNLLDSLQDSFYLSGNLLNGNLISFFILNSLWFHLPLILMIIVSGLITTEFEDGTIRTVLLQDVSGSKLIVAKFIVGAIFTVLCVLILALSAIGASYLLFGQGDLLVYFGGLTFFEQDQALKRIVMAFAAGTVTMLFYSFASLTLGIWLRQTIRTWIMAALLLVVSNMLLQLQLGFAGMDKWFYAAQLDSWQSFFYREIPWTRLTQSLAVLVVYTLAVAYTGVWLFNKRDIG